MCVCIDIYKNVYNIDVCAEDTNRWRLSGMTTPYGIKIKEQ